MIQSGLAKDATIYFCVLEGICRYELYVPLYSSSMSKLDAEPRKSESSPMEACSPR